jgi:hypothetical protein
MKKLLITLTIFSFLSCANMTPEQKTQVAQSAIQAIQIGMSIAEVTGLLHVTSPRSQSADTVLKYENYNLHFQDDKLIAITPEGFR